MTGQPRGAARRLRALLAEARVDPGRDRACTPASVAFARPWPTTRRGLKLWVIALAIGLKGAGYVFAPSRGTEASLRLFTEVLAIPLQVCGLVIIGLCLTAAFSGYCHHGRDRWGYGILIGFTLGWAAAFAVSPLVLDGPDAALQGTLSYLLFALLLIICAGDPEPVDGSTL